MNILMVAPSYYPNVGGVEYVVKSVAERLAKMGHSVAVLAGDPGAERPAEEEINGVQVVRWPTWAPAGAYHVPKRRAHLRETLRQLAEGAHVVHIHNAHAVFSVWAGLAVDATRLVFTPHYHGAGHSTVRNLLWTLWRRYVARLVEEADVVHAVSPREARLIEQHYPAARGKVVTIPNGVEEDVFAHRWRGADSGYTIYAGRVEKYKRLRLAVDLAGELGLRLVVVGKGPHLEELRRYARRRGVAAEFLEPQPRAEYLRLIAGARYAVNPSRQEAFSIFAAEALAMGVPTITTPEIAEALSARYVPFRDRLVEIKYASVPSWEEVLPRLLRLYVSRP